VLEEGLRGAGGHLLNGAGERFMQRYDAQGERATRDIVSRSIVREMRAGQASPGGGVYIRMEHLGPELVRRQFKGMVERCADCGFDLAGGLVEVVPTAHYMMGGVTFEADCSTALRGLFAAGEDTGGVHGANRLGGNGVANSTVFGGIAGDTLADWVARHGRFEDPDELALQQAVARCTQPLTRPPGNLEAVREALYEVMWEDVGILRHADGLRRAGARLSELDKTLDGIGVDASDLRFNLTWHDWLNLKNLILVSQAITVAALARENSRGAHYREDFPDPDSIDESEFIALRWHKGIFDVSRHAVNFTRVRPGATLLASEPDFANPL
jgi:fumarate reductase flavoprotein subunit